MNTHYTNCLLCHDAPCSKVCPGFNPERIIRALRFDNAPTAMAFLPEIHPDADIIAKCQDCCPAGIDLKGFTDEVYEMKVAAGSLQPHAEAHLVQSLQR